MLLLKPSILLWHYAPASGKHVARVEPPTPSHLPLLNTSQTSQTNELRMSSLCFSVLFVLCRNMPLLASPLLCFHLLSIPFLSLHAMPSTFAFRSVSCTSSFSCIVFAHLAMPVLVTQCLFLSNIFPVLPGYCCHCLPFATMLRAPPSCRLTCRISALHPTECRCIAPGSLLVIHACHHKTCSHTLGS